jgi:hypothetical protein
MTLLYFVSLRLLFPYGENENMSLLFRSQTKREHDFVHFYSFQNPLLPQEIKNENFWTQIG